MEVGNFAGPVHIDRLDFSTQLRIAAVGEHAAMVLLMLFPQQLQQPFPKAAALIRGTQQSHGLI